MTTKKKKKKKTPKKHKKIGLKVQVSMDGPFHPEVVMRRKKNPSKSPHRKVDYTCECPLDPGEKRRLYKVTGHDGSTALCAYCPACAELAAMDWNGETAKIQAARRNPDVHLRWQRKGGFHYAEHGRARFLVHNDGRGPYFLHVGAASQGWALDPQRLEPVFGPYKTAAEAYRAAENLAAGRQAARTYRKKNPGTKAKFWVPYLLVEAMSDYYAGQFDPLYRLRTQIPRATDLDYVPRRMLKHGPDEIPAYFVPLSADDLHAVIDLCLRIGEFDRHRDDYRADDLSEDLAATAEWFLATYDR